MFILLTDGVTHKLWYSLERSLSQEAGLDLFSLFLYSCNILPPIHRPSRGRLSSARSMLLLFVCTHQSNKHTFSIRHQSPCRCLCEWKLNKPVYTAPDLVSAPAHTQGLVITRVHRPKGRGNTKMRSGGKLKLWGAQLVGFGESLVSKVAVPCIALVWVWTSQNG